MKQETLHVRRRVAELERDIQEKEVEMSTNRREIFSLEEQLSASIRRQVDIERREQMCKEMEISSSQTNDELQRLRSVVLAFMDEKDKLQTKLQKSEKELTTLHGTLDKLSQDKLDLELKLKKQCPDTCNQVDLELASAKEDNNNLEQKLNKLMASNTNLQTLLDTKTKELSLCQEKLKSTSTQLEQAQNKLQEMLTEFDMSKSRLEEMKAELKANQEQSKEQLAAEIDAGSPRFGVPSSSRAAFVRGTGRTQPVQPQEQEQLDKMASKWRQIQQESKEKLAKFVSNDHNANQQ